MREINIFKNKKIVTDANSHHIAGRNEFMEMNGGLVKSEAFWRMLAYIAVVGFIVLGIGFIMLTQQRTVAAYIVTLDNQGKTQNIARLDPQKELPKEFIQSELLNFVVYWRTVTADFDLQQKMTGKLSYFLAGTAKGQIKEWYENHNPYNQAKNGKLIQIEVKGLPLPVSKDSWRVEWQEYTRSHTGILLNTETFAATMSVKIIPPLNEQQIMFNPGGVTVTEISVAKVLN